MTHVREITLSSPPGGAAPLAALSGFPLNAAKSGLLARALHARLRSHVERRPVAECIAHAGDERASAMVRSLVGDATATDPAWLGITAQGIAVAEILTALEPVSGFGQLAAKGLYVEFPGDGTARIAYRSAGSISAAWIGAGGAIPLGIATLAAKTLDRNKLAVITTLTKELAAAGVNAQRALWNLLITDFSVAIDTALFDANAAIAGMRPAGLALGATAVTPSTSTVEVEACLADLRALADTVYAADKDARSVAFVMHPGHALVLAAAFPNRLPEGVSVIHSAALAQDRVLALCPEKFAFALSVPETDMDDHGSALVMANADASAPTHATDAADRTIVGDAGYVPPGGGISIRDPAQQAAGKVGENAVVVSMFQQYSLALRAVFPTSWTLCGGVVAEASGVLW